MNFNELVVAQTTIFLDYVGWYSMENRHTNSPHRLTSLSFRTVTHKRITFSCNHSAYEPFFNAVATVRPKLNVVHLMFLMFSNVQFSFE